MDGLSADIHGGNARGRQQNNIFICVMIKIIEQCGFAGTGASRNENIFIRLFHQLQRPPELGIQIYFD